MVQGEKEEVDDKEEKYYFEICLFQVKCHINLNIKSFFVLILSVWWGWCQRLYYIAENLHPEMGLECFKQWYSETRKSRSGCLFYLTDQHRCSSYIMLPRNWREYSAVKNIICFSRYPGSVLSTHMLTHYICNSSSRIFDSPSWPHRY